MRSRAVPEGGLARLLLSLTCFLLFSVASGPLRAADFYIDPVAGDDAGDGSSVHPWRSLQAVLDAGKVQTRDWPSLPYAEGAELVDKNVGAPVGPGDTIWLRDGYHGRLELQSHYNAAPITIRAEHLGQARFASILVRSSENWVVRGLSVSAEYDAEFERQTLINVESHNWRGPVRNVVVEGCALSTVSDSAPWSAADWDTRACNGISVSGDDVTVRENVLRNVNFGISVSGKRALVLGNTVENFSGDGLRGLGDDGVFESNLIRNCYDVNENHDDGFQSWSVGEDGVGSGVVRGIVLRGNTIINYSDPQQPLRGTLQGIGCFDGFFEDWVIENNVIVVDHWHGITLMGARNVRVFNNTVLDLNEERPGPPWIRISAHKDGRPAENCIVRNNLTTALSLDAEGVSEDHNLIIDDPAAFFVDHLSHDLHLLAGSPAVDAGSADGAPATDHDGLPRALGTAVDVGAFEYNDGSWPPVLEVEGEELELPVEEAEDELESTVEVELTELSAEDELETAPDSAPEALEADVDAKESSESACACALSTRAVLPNAFVLLLLCLGMLLLGRRAAKTHSEP
ncbi:MAG: right-handed parallel beta-helix repeat-containing protein [Myxococcota bacterium]|jgi:hypothetical protein|nr:right-handed parallel beta-helix repeat-containing protein [Myxococcota bacterium]